MRDEQLVTAIDRSGAALVVVDHEGRVERWGRGAEALWGWTSSHVIGRRWSEFGVIVDSARRAQADAMTMQVLAGEASAGEWVSRCADGTTKRVQTIYEPVRDGDRIVGIVSLSFDLSRLEQFEQALVREALHDQLTGLPGRELVAHAVTAAQDSGSGAAVLFVDLDDFKAVNDRHGHRAGDEVLIEVARRLRAAVRSSDVVGRVGGDEFVAVAAMDGSRDVGRELAGRIRTALAAPIDLSGGLSLMVSASVGVAISEPGDSIDAVMHRADEAMYREKPVDED